MIDIRITSKATLKDIAKDAGVGLGTASRVLNGNPSVKETSRKAVQDSMKRLNYKPNAIARSLKTKTTQTIGVMIPDIANPFYPEVVRGLEDISKIYKYNIFLSNTDMNTDSLSYTIDMFREKKVDGVVFISNSITKKLVDEFKELDVPLILVSCSDNDGEFSSITIDNKTAAYEIVDYLCGLGHKKIAHLAGRLTSSASGQDRFEGYRNALKKNGVIYNKNYVIDGDFRFKSSYSNMKQLLELDDIPTAVFASSDIMAIGAAKAILESGYKIPEDISIIGIDGIEHAEYFHPPISSVKVQRYDMGAIAMRLLTKLLNREEVEQKHYTVDFELIDRGSCKKI